MWVQDRFDEGRRLAERTFNEGRKVAERTFKDGSGVAERSWHDGRKVAERAYDEGRDVAGRTYEDGRREAEQRLRQAHQLRREAERRLEEGRRFLAPRLDNGRRTLDDGRRAIRDRFGDRAPAVEAGVAAGAVIWPILVLGAGASIAYFCWSQYMRGRSERHDRFLDEPGGAGPRIPEPEMVMAHSPAPSPEGHEAVDHYDADLAEPAEELMMHAPLDEEAPPSNGAVGGMKAAPRAAILKRRVAKSGSTEQDAKALAAAAAAAQASRSPALEESLAVQGAASASKRQSPNGATPAAGKPKRKGGPTVM